MLLDAKLPVSYILNSIRADLARVMLISGFFQVLKWNLESYLPPILLPLPATRGLRHCPSWPLAKTRPG